MEERFNVVYEYLGRAGEYVKGRFGVSFKNKSDFEKCDWRKGKKSTWYKLVDKGISTSTAQDLCEKVPFSGRLDACREASINGGKIIPERLSIWTFLM